MEPTDRQKDRAERFVARAQAIRSFNASETGDLAFMGRPLVQLTLPHDDPGDIEYYERVNGDTSLIIQPGFVREEGKARPAGIPFGVYPRLVLAWVTTEAVRTKNRQLVLGGSLTAFMNELGLTTAGGRTIGLLRDQMNRLFTARIAVVRGEKGRLDHASMEITRRARLWWDHQHPDEPVMFNSTIQLSDDFFHMVTERPVPVDMRALQVLKSSPLGLDLYMWLTYRVSYMRRETVISWKQLESQLGADYADTKNFARSAKRELKKIQLVWPDLKITTPRGRLVVKPCAPHVAKLRG